MSRDPYIVAKEMLVTIDFIDESLKDHDIQSFSNDWQLRLAAQRAIEIISEASRHLPHHLLDSEPSVEWRKIRDMGNFLRHEYHHVQDEIVWDVCATRLNPLRAALERMLKRL